jgi:hypothetical protein
MMRGVGNYISNIYQTAVRNQNTYASIANTPSPYFSPTMVALALLLRYTPSFANNTPNPFYFAVAAYVDAGLNIVGWENDKGFYFVLAGKSIGEVIGYDEFSHYGLGTDVGIQVELGRVDYTGNPGDFDPENHLQGLRSKGYFSVGPVGIAASFSHVDPGVGNLVWCTSISFGLGASVLGPVATGFNSGTVKTKK